MTNRRLRGARRHDSHRIGAAKSRLFRSRNQNPRGLQGKHLMASGVQLQQPNTKNDTQEYRSSINRLSMPMKVGWKVCHYGDDSP
jgi:hypothetical protein